MQWLGKAIGAALGFAVAGPVGSIFGALLGHQFDRGQGQVAQTSQRTQNLFFRVTFEVMGYLAKVDGRVTEEEIRIARRIMHAMRLTPEQVGVAIDRFTAGKAADYALDARIAELKSAIGSRRDLNRAFVEIQLQAAVGGGELAPAKRQCLWQVARDFGIGRVELAQMEALVRAAMHSQSPARATEAQQSLEAAYRTLGIEAAASDKDVKTAYRRLMNQHHPDKLVARGLPESMVTIAEQKTREIRSAYERIKTQRGFK